MKIRSYVALTALTVLVAPTVSWAAKLTCLTGTGADETVAVRVRGDRPCTADYQRAGWNLWPPVVPETTSGGAFLSAWRCRSLVTRLGVSSTVTTSRVKGICGRLPSRSPHPVREGLGKIAVLPTSKGSGGVS